MNAGIGQKMTLLGLGAMAFYGVLLSTGTLSLEVMPQFLVSAVIFLSSGRLLRMAAKSLERDEETPAERPKGPEPDWPWLTALLNWTAAMLVIGTMAIILMKPAGVSFLDALTRPMPHDHFAAEFVP